jgi:hypothetical protein
MCRYFVVAGVIVDVCSALRLYLSAVNAKPTDADPPLLDVLTPQGFFFSAVGTFCDRVTIAGTFAAVVVTVLLCSPPRTEVSDGVATTPHHKLRTRGCCCSVVAHSYIFVMIM